MYIFVSQVWREKLKLKANIFLVDFGSTIETEVRKKVRKLEVKDQAAEPPLAFKIILEGLYPVSMVKSKALTLHFLTRSCRISTGNQENEPCSPPGLLRL